MKSYYLPLVTASLLVIPVVASAQLPDNDGDGLPDIVETNTGIFVSPTNTGTSPTNPDTDGDGFSDGTEVLRFGTSPVDLTDEPFFKTVGEPRNPDEDLAGVDSENAGRGYVGEEFEIAVTEVTNTMYARFLNAVAEKDDLYGLYTVFMGVYGGITRLGPSKGPYTYTVRAGWEGRPVAFVSVFDAMRYINWLHNGMPKKQVQDETTTEDGAYDLRGINSRDIARRKLGAKYFLPDQHEWHKAAYFDPDPGSGLPTDFYWPYADQSFSGPGGNFGTVLAAAGTSAGPSHYGTYDQDGNAREWTESGITGPTGGANHLTAIGGVTFENDGWRRTALAQTSPTTASATLGFRVARPSGYSPTIQETVPLMALVDEADNLSDEEFARETGDARLGSVGRIFQMGAYEVTNLDYADFLNVKAKKDSFYRLYDTRMGSDAANGGIIREGRDGNYSYKVKAGFAKKPVVYVSIYSAMRYCNWLHNGGGAASDTEWGAYRLLGTIPPDTSKLTRNSGARYYLPNAAEFYKAAYYDSSTAANATFDYWKFATRSDLFNPVLNSSPLADVSLTSDSDDNNLYDAGAASYFGTYGQSGNVGYASPGSGANTPAPEPTAANTGELLEEAKNTDDESALRTFRIAAAAGVESLPPLGDEDRDGLPNAWEVLHGLDPFDDGVDNLRTPALNDGNPNNGANGDPDFEELLNFEEYASGADPLLVDTDGDGLDDKSEVKVHGTDPAKPDSDKDGMPDKWEVDNGLNPINPADALQDADGDGLGNLREYQLGTNPRDPDSDDDGLNDGAEVDTHRADPLDSDTDNDGMPDGWEVQYALNPLVNDATQDADGDGLSNLREYQLGTNPRDPDSDDDGLNDGAEVDTHRTDPLDSDTDNDGMPDGWEVYYGRNPLSAADRDTDNDGIRNTDDSNPLMFDTPGAAPSMVTVGAPGNTGAGAVAYAYRISTYEVTNDDYARFLNAVAQVSDTKLLYDARMAYAAQEDASDPWDLRGSGGIVRSGVAGSYTYRVKAGFGSKPVNFVKYDSALRYCNWLHNGGEIGGDTEKGAYDMSNASIAGPAKARATDWARFWLPNYNEWYKAAAYDIAAGPRYWQFAIRADSATTSQVSVRPYTELVNVDQVIDNRSAVFPAPPSYFGTFGQSGNAAEWVEAANPSQPSAHGGSILSTSGWQYANVGDGVKTTSAFQPLNGGGGRYDIGFRIAAIAPVTLVAPTTFAARYPTMSPNDLIDGSPAIVDYFHGGTASSPAPVENLPVHSVKVGKMRYSFVARTDDVSLRYEVQTAINVLGPWTTNGVSMIEQTALTSELSRRTFEVSTVGDRQRFFRLLVEP